MELAENREQDIHEAIQKMSNAITDFVKTMQELLEPIIEEVKIIVNAIWEKIIKSVNDKTIKKCLHISKNSKNKRIQKKQITRINKIMKWYIRQATYELNTNSK